MNRDDFAAKRPAPAATQPAADESTRLATLPRQYNGQRSELRVERTSFNGSKPFTKLQIWEQGPHGCFPTKKIVTVRDGELAAVIAALLESQKLAGNHGSGDAR